MTFQERYQYNLKTDLLGKGGFARVYKAKDILLDREVAIKIFNATDKGQYTVIEEIKKAIRLQHPNLLRYYDVAVLENTNALGENDVLQIGVMELANAGDLKQFANSNPKSPVLFKLLKQVLSGLEYLHNKGIIHRDLKPQNILLVEEDGELTAKISDFGISKSIDSGTNSSSMAIGTIEYMAPEQFNPTKYGINGKISTNIDLWSFGIMVHELLTNEPLFGQRSGNTTAEQIMSAILSSEIPNGINNLPEPYKEAVKKCLIKDANDRVQKANELIGLLKEEYSSQDIALETMVFDKSQLAKARQFVESETIAIPTINNHLEYSDLEKPVEKKSHWVYFFAAAILVLVIGGIWVWLSAGTTKPIEKNEGLEEYHLAISNKSDKNYYINHLKKASELGYDSANFDLANYYINKDEVANAAPYITKLVDSNNNQITSRFAGIVAKYALVLADINHKPNEGIAVAQSNADAGDVDCAYQLGLFYYEGKATQQDYELALKYFKKAAEKKSTEAQTMLGTMYITGQGVQADNSVAIEYYYKAASNNNMVAMYALGLAYANGKGVEKNIIEAQKWFQQVVDKGNKPALIEAAKQQLANF